jgi:signal transduction histidine kinase
MLAVQQACRSRFAAEDATAAEARLARRQARLLRRQHDLERERAASHRFFRAVAENGTAVADAPGSGGDGDGDAAGVGSVSDGSPPALRHAWQAWIDQREALARLSAQLDAISDAYRARTQPGTEPTGRSKLAALAEFAAGAAHELNNPLAVILGRAQLLLARSGDDPEAARSLRAIVGQAQRATRMLRDLIYVARPPGLRLRRCQPDEILRAALRDLQAEAEARRVALRAGFSEPSAWGWSDPDGLRHLAEVLIRNALEASPDGSTVTLSARSREEELSWTVHNQGRPITARERRHLFDPFFCGRQAGRGLGLGLARVARFVADSGGQIHWWSDRGRGTSFHVHLPLPGPGPETAGAIQSLGADEVPPHRAIDGSADANRAFLP